MILLLSACFQQLSAVFNTTASLVLVAQLLEPLFRTRPRHCTGLFKTVEKPKAYSRIESIAVVQLDLIKPLIVILVSNFQ